MKKVTDFALETLRFALYRERERISIANTTQNQVCAGISTKEEERRIADLERAIKALGWEP